MNQLSTPKETLPVLYQDEHLVVVNKPSGLLVHRSMIDRHETRFALQIIRDQIGQYVYPVHRLDKPTSGILVMALSKEAARLIGEQFTNNLVQKTYLAVVRGYADDFGAINHPLKEQLDKIADKDAQQDKDAQNAVTEFKTLAKIEIPYEVERYPTSRYSLVEASPKTGRKHQIRRHMKHVSHPIIGDANHGRGKHNRFFQKQFNVNRLLLACTGISFLHPTTKELINISCPVDGEFLSLLEKFEWVSHNAPLNLSNIKPYKE